MKNWFNVLEGGIKVKMGKKMCEILTEDGRVFPVMSLVDGHVIEINDAVEQDPNILLDYVRRLFCIRLNYNCINCFPFYCWGFVYVKSFSIAWVQRIYCHHKLWLEDWKRMQKHDCRSSISRTYIQGSWSSKGWRNDWRKTIKKWPILDDG